MNASLIRVALEKNCLCTEPHKPARMHCPYRCVFLICSFVYQVDCLWGRLMIHPAVLFWASLLSSTTFSSTPRAASGTLRKWAPKWVFVSVLLCEHEVGQTRSFLEQPLPNYHFHHVLRGTCNVRGYDWYQWSCKGYCYSRM